MTGVRRCLGCGALGRWDRSGRCDACRRAVIAEVESELRRRTRKADRYDAAHRKLRARWARIIASGRPVKCGRSYSGECLKPAPHLVHAGDRWDLDHLETLGNIQHPSHEVCNRSASRRLRS